MKIKTKDLRLGVSVRLMSKDVSFLKSLIADQGLLKPILVGRKLIVKDGNRRMIACRELGIEEVECVFTPDVQAFVDSAIRNGLTAETIIGCIKKDEIEPLRESDVGENEEGSYYVVLKIEEGKLRFFDQGGCVFGQAQPGDPAFEMPINVAKVEFLKNGSIKLHE